MLTSTRRSGRAGAARHLRIALADYDRMIRTLIPYYDEMLDAVARAVHGHLRQNAVLVDLGVGTGALAERCVASRPRVRVIGIDEDPGMLNTAATRLARRRPELIRRSFETGPLPSCDAIVASFALHHIRTRRRKTALYRRAHRALAPGGLFVNADCCPPSRPDVARVALAGWHAHVRQTYSGAETARFFRSWSREDFYMALGDELTMLRRAAFDADVTWRRDAFAVIVASKRRRLPR